MPAPASVEEFLDLVQKSGVLDGARLDAHVQKLKAAGTLPTEPGKFAGLLVRDALLTYFQAEQLLQGKWKRFYIGKYKVLERLGSGGMGQVFLCEHKLMKRRVAVKVLPTAKAADRSSLDRFYREARAIAALDHPNIVRAYDIDQDENLHFLVMEFVDGTNLQDLVKKFGPLDVLRACHYAYGAAVGLQYAYEMGILHRDIKPANILVDRAGVVKILDMGLARFFNDEEDNLTRKYDENVLGTADYLSPEQAVDSHGVDIRADIYSLGGTFYFMLTGLPPFPDGSVAQKLLWHQTRDPKPVRALRPDVPEGVAAIIAKMMVKNPAARYTTPADLMAALSPWVQTPIPPPPERELPQFSPAAVGFGTGPKAAAASGVLYAGSELPTRVGPATAVPGTLPAAEVAAPAAPTSTVPEAAPAGIWESLASETRANAQADTGSVLRGSSRRKLVPSTPGQSRRRTLFLILAAIFGLLALGGVVSAVYFLFGAAIPPPPSPRGVATARTWYVTTGQTSPDADHAVPTLLTAIQRAVPGDKILLLDDQIEDPPIRLDAGRFRMRNLTIEAGNAAGRVRWVPAKGVKAAAVLEVIGVEGLRLAGLAIEANGQFDAGLSVVGHVPGLEVEDVTVRGPRVAGVQFTGASGDPGRPAVLTRVRVTAETPFESGVVFAEGNRGDPRTATRHVRLVNSRMDGPAQAGVRVVGAAADLEIKHTRFYNVAAGIVFADLSENQPLKVAITGNTFHSVHEAGIRVDEPIPETLAHEVRIARNYFSQTAILTTTPGGQFPGLRADTNARDAQSSEGNVSLAATPLPNAELDTFDPDSDGFLLYPKDSPLNAVGPKKLPVGVPPQ